MFSKLLGWEGEDLNAIDFACAAYLSTYLPGDRERTWGVLVSPASTGKTEILRAFRDCDPRVQAPQRTVEMDDLTENAFSSAWRDEENPDDDKSILAKLDARRPPGGPKVLVVTEMTNALSLPKERRTRLFGQLRKAYDGDYHNHAGQLGLVFYELGFGFLGACTEAIDHVRKQDQPLGERLVLCRIVREAGHYKNRFQRTSDALDRDPHEKKRLREELRQMVTGQIDACIKTITTTPGWKIEQPPELLTRLKHLGTVVATIRTVPVSSDTYASAPEGGARIAQQLQTWADARAAFDNRLSWNQDDIDLCRRIAQDTLPPDFLRALRFIWGSGPAEAARGKLQEQIALAAGVEESMYRQFRQWRLSGLLTEKEKGTYAFTPDMIDAIVASGLFDGLDKR